jgi:selenophosphate synthetase-related protein
MEEQTIYSDNAGIRITSARAVFGGTTYSMANVASVSMESRSPSVTGEVFLAIMGFGVLMCGGPAMQEDATMLAIVVCIGLAMAIAGIALAVRAKKTYIVMIQSASGKANALSSKDKDYIENIVRAMNEAFIHRG